MYLNHKRKEMNSMPPRGLKGNAKPKDFKSSYRCCNDCASRTCTNRCKEDCKTCGVVADIKWVEEMEARYSSKLVFQKPEDKVKTGGKPKNSKPSVEVKKSLDPEAKKARDREARRKRRLARKAKNKGKNKSNDVLILHFPLLLPLQMLFGFHHFSNLLMLTMVTILPIIWILTLNTVIWTPSKKCLRVAMNEE